MTGHPLAPCAWPPAQHGGHTAQGHCPQEASHLRGDLTPRGTTAKGTCSAPHTCSQLQPHEEGIVASVGYRRKLRLRKVI